MKTTPNEMSVMQFINSSNQILMIIRIILLKALYYVQGNLLFFLALLTAFPSHSQLSNKSLNPIEISSKLSYNGTHFSLLRMDIKNFKISTINKHKQCCIGFIIDLRNISSVIFSAVHPIHHHHRHY